MPANLVAGWIAFLLGSLAGVVTGLYFAREDWLGGYGAWTRRMVRLGHVSFFGLGLLNVAFALTARARGIDHGLALPSVLLIAGTALMPLVCYLSAARSAFRHLFALPALSVTVAVAAFLRRLIAP